MMTPTNLSDDSDPEPHRVILATVDGESDTAKHRESQLKSSIRQEVQICQFTNSHDSTRSILDTILGFDPIKLQDIQDELEKICTANRNFFSTLLEDPDQW